ncbi:MAG: hypothetical protein OXE95_04110 [Chloroflexi bacterium]|nr:hypothetical protein [Chloroflexota bacterium]MCY4246746.1 hypothetical protein [Chloroflexota bacterium]
MGLEDTIAEAIIMGMDELAGNPRRAVESAMDCASAAQWIKQETTKLALIGGAEMVLPGLHAFTIPTGVSYLLHKMGYISWGIGALKGAFVIETEAYSDLRNILGLWANEGHFDAAIIEHLAVSLDALDWALSEPGQAAMPALLESPVDATTVRTYHILQRLVENLVAGDERGYAVLCAMRGEAEAARLLAAGKETVQHLNCEVMLTRPMGRKVSRRLAYKLASRIGTRIPARMIVGFLPVAGAVANAFMNAQTLQSMAEAAEKYYDRRLRREHLLAVTA